MDVISLLLGVLIGGLIVAARLVPSRQRLAIENARLASDLSAERDKLVAERAVVDEARAQLVDTFRAVGAEALDKSNQGFLQLAEQRFRQLLVEQQRGGEQQQQNIDQLVKPLQQLLSQQNDAVRALELKRENAYTDLVAQISHVTSAHQKLTSETGKLVTALARPTQRGRWGELQLQRVVELSGMTKHCDFHEQVHVSNGDRAFRPDLVVHLPRGREIIVDAKVPLDAYLAASDANANRDERLAAHARCLRDHFKKLSSKQYWTQFAQTPDIVVMFVPVESALLAAMEHDPTLHADALESRVLIATPTLLVAVLRAVGYGWQQESIAQNAREIADVGAQLHDRVGTFLEHMQKVGASLGTSVASYNKAVGSLEGRMLVTARKLKDLGATNANELASVDMVDQAVRHLAINTLGVDA